MKFRFTLNNTTAGPLVISEPGGWDEATLKLERNDEFHSLVEYYDLPALLYGESLSYLSAIERSQGPDAQVSVLVRTPVNLERIQSDTQLQKEGHRGKPIRIRGTYRVTFSALSIA